jgi:para-nitrobenzyl esterase
MGGDPANFTLSWDQLPAKLTLANLRVDIDPATVIAQYRRLYPAYSPSDVFFAATTAGRSWRAAVIEAEMRAMSSNPAWVYQFDFPTVRSDGQVGAGHGSDIVHAFDNVEAGRRGGPETPHAAAMTRQMSETFVTFAKTGDPNNATIPRWERYELPRRQTMVFNATSRLVDDPRGDERQFFAKVPYIQPGT